MVFKVSRVFLDSFNDVSRKFLRVFTESFKSVSIKFQGNHKGGLINVSGVFQVRGQCLSSSFERVSRTFEKSLESVSGKFK